MPDDSLPRVGDRVNVDGRAGVFFVLQVDWDTFRATTGRFSTKFLWEP